MDHGGGNDLWGTLSDLVYAAVSIAIAIFFGFIRYAQQFTDPANAERFRWQIAALKGVIAGAAGLLAGWLSQYWLFNKYLAWIFIATAGYAGAEFLQTLKEVIYDQLRKRADATAKP